MKYFLDTEFIESGQGKPIHLISLALVAEDGVQRYWINQECPLWQANDWVKANVLPYLEPNPDRNHRCLLEDIRLGVLGFVDPNPEFWGYYADYDWVVFCQIFGAMIDLPKGWPMYCRDIKQWADDLGNVRIPKQESTEHNALNDALWSRQAWGFLKNMVDSGQAAVAR